MQMRASVIVGLDRHDWDSLLGLRRLRCDCRETSKELFHNRHI